MKPRLLIDLDGTVADVHGYALRLNYLRHSVCQWDMECCLVEGIEMTDIWENTNVFRFAPPIEGAIAGVNMLRDYFDIHFVSTPWHANHASAHAKFAWVEEHFGDPKLLTLTHHKEHYSGVALVDDKPGLVGPWDHICYPQAWNDSVEPTWAEGLAYRLIGGYAS